MPLSIGFRWNVPKADPIEKPSTSGNFLRAAGEAVTQVKRGQMEREDRERNEQDRQRRISEEDRQKSLYGETAEMIRGKKEQRDALVKRRDELKARIAQLKGVRGG